MTGAVCRSRTWARRWSVSRSRSAAPRRAGEARAEREQVRGDSLPHRHPGLRVHHPGGHGLRARCPASRHLTVVPAHAGRAEDLGGQVQQLAAGAGCGLPRLAVAFRGVQPAVRRGHPVPLPRRGGPVGQGQRGGVGGTDAVPEEVVEQYGQQVVVDGVGLEEALQAVGEGVEPAGERRVGQLEADQEVPQVGVRHPRATGGPARFGGFGALVAVHGIRPGRTAG